MKSFGSLFALLLCTMYTVSSQAFDAKAFVGFTLSQMEGDNLAGFDKMGLSGGAQVLYHISDKVLVGMEVGFIQKGSRQGALDLKLYNTDVITTLNYTELPILIEFRDWYMSQEDYYKISGHIGISYSLLISAESAHDDIGIFSDQFGNDLSFIGGGTYAINHRWSTTLRYQRALNQMYQNDSLTTGGLLNYLWTLRLGFSF